MPTFTETIQVAADPDAAWRVLGDLAAVDGIAVGTAVG